MREPTGARPFGSQPIRTQRAGDLSTRSQAWKAFIAHRSPRLLLVASSTAIVVRLLLGDFDRYDGLVVAVTLALIGPFEWIVHRHLLHAPATSFRARRLGTGSGHAAHHLDPDDLRWLLLSGSDALVFAGGIGVVTAVWSIPIGLAAGASPVAISLSAWCVGLMALTHYEWTHLLVHTRYRCRSRHYRALARHHRLHHYRSERYWLGVTTRSGDRLAGTMPERGAVPLSSTARTLGANDPVAG